ncbi:MAG: hypothetical protein U5L11_07850 [Arhodomonas sp.]|nr:hypothetical protein [Arhodomonas sp.]
MPSIGQSPVHWAEKVADDDRRRHRDRESQRRRRVPCRRWRCSGR